MNTVSIGEARRRLSRIVGAAERGEVTIITRHGRPVAKIVSADAAGERRLPDLSEFRASIQVRGRPLSQVVADARDEARY